MKEKEEIPLLHVYGQGEPHEELWIVGNRPGLSQLVKALQEALEERTGKEEAFVAGPEGGFLFWVLLLEEPSHSSFWQELAVPYRGQEWAEEKRPDAIWPIQLAPTRKLPVPEVRESE